MKKEEETSEITKMIVHACAGAATLFIFVVLAMLLFGYDFCKVP